MRGAAAFQVGAQHRTEFPGNERKTIFQVDDQTRYKYDTLLGRIPID